MHELGIVFHVIKKAWRRSRRKMNDKVSAVTLSSGKCPASTRLISDCWRWAADRTEVLSGSELNIKETIHAVTHCDDCGREYDTVAW